MGQVDAGIPEPDPGVRRGQHHPLARVEVVRAASTAWRNQRPSRPSAWVAQMSLIGFAPL